MYKQTWELHPLVVAKEYQNLGLGRRLLSELEAQAKAQGLIGIFLGTDDETYSTSLSQVTLTEANLWAEISRIKNLNHHPYEFYQRCGYMITGVVPNANGPGKPDIWMWKSLL
jgi:aminoglycoside 6'-N-acetyltransferase I